MWQNEDLLYKWLASVPLYCLKFIAYRLYNELKLSDVIAPEIVYELQKTAVDDL